MTDQPDPRPLSDADLLAWAVVLGYRDQQQRDGISVLLLPLPPCPTCKETVHDGTAAWVREISLEELTIDMRPCGYSHRASLRDLEALNDHVAAMMHNLEHQAMTTDDIVREAHARVGEPELTVDEAQDLVSDLSANLYWAQDRLGFVGECCDIADREQRAITTADVREWLKGARCGRQLAADAATADEATEPAAWSQLEARAVNAVGPALREVGEWLRLSARRAVAKAVLAAIQPELAAHYQHAVDAAVAAEQRATQADAAGARVREVAARIRQGAPWTANHDDIADRIEAALDDPNQITGQAGEQP